MPSNHNNIFQNGTSRQRSSVFWCLLALGLALIGVDQLVKYWFFAGGVSTRALSSPWVRLVEFRNEQFAFSIPLPAAVIFLIYAVVLGLLINYVIRYRAGFSQRQWLAWTLIFSGSASNIVERIALGYVRDFLYLWGGGIFNLADLYIIFGILILILGKQEK